MAPTLRSALAVEFTWTSGGTDLALTFPSGASPVNVTLASGDYRVLLAPTTGSVTDCLRALQSAINAAMAGAGRAETFTVTMGADSLVTLAISTGTFSATLSSLLRVLGFAAAPSGVASAVAGWPPKYFATFIERVSQDWTESTAVAGSETLGGVGYGVTSGVYTWRDEIAFGWIPRDPVQRASLAVNQSPWHPNDADLATLGNHNVPWGVSDVLAVALGKSVAYAAGNLQTLLTSTTERYNVCTLPSKELAAPRKARTREGWDAYFRWTCEVIRQASTPTATRA